MALVHQLPPARIRRQQLIAAPTISYQRVLAHVSGVGKRLRIKLWLLPVSAEEHETVCRINHMLTRNQRALVGEGAHAGGALLVIILPAPLLVRGGLLR